MSDQAVTNKEPVAFPHTEKALAAYDVLHKEFDESDGCNTDVLVLLKKLDEAEKEVAHAFWRDTSDRNSLSTCLRCIGVKDARASVARWRNNEAEYVKAQTVYYKSLESQNSLWRVGQERAVKMLFNKTSREARILDCACGDGVGLEVFRSLNFENIEAVELCEEKALLAGRFGYPVFVQDFHLLEDFMHLGTSMFDIVYSSHSLEHAHSPRKVLRGFRRLLKPGGLLQLILPFPDTGPLEAHPGKQHLGTESKDTNATLIAVLEENGFTVINSKLDDFREPEIWITAVRKEFARG